MSASQAFVMMDPEALVALVKTAVSEALAEHREDRAPAVLDRNGLARALGCSPSQVDRLRRVGLPCVRVGDVPRFELARCLEWLRQRGNDETMDPEDVARRQQAACFPRSRAPPPRIKAPAFRHGRCSVLRFAPSSERPHPARDPAG